ncbi:hypothetical protein D3C73_1300430 [compost metagenome]
MERADLKLFSQHRQRQLPAEPLLHNGICLGGQHRIGPEDAACLGAAPFAGAKARCRSLLQRSIEHHVACLGRPGPAGRAADDTGRKYSRIIHPVIGRFAVDYRSVDTFKQCLIHVKSPHTASINDCFSLMQPSGIGEQDYDSRRLMAARREQP